MLGKRLVQKADRVCELQLKVSNMRKLEVLVNKIKRI
jgi:hypothetical protein